MIRPRYLLIVATLLASSVAVTLGGAFASHAAPPGQARTNEYRDQDAATPGGDNSDEMGAAAPANVAAPPTVSQPTAHNEASREIPVRENNVSRFPGATPDTPIARSEPAGSRSVKATPIPRATPASLATFAPAQIRIPAIQVDALILPVGITPEGAMEAPEDYARVGWYRYGPVPGERGRAVLAGHVDSTSGPAIFFKLDQLQPGDEVRISSGIGSELTFVVRETAVYDTDLAPSDQIFGPSDRHELILITCDGTFDSSGGGYLQRRVIYAELVDNLN